MAFLPLAAAAAILISPGGPQASPAKLYDGLGGLHRKATGATPLGQRYVDQGLAFLFAFNYDEAARSFGEATRQSPNCPIAWWGLAMANGPHYNNLEVAPESAKVAWEALGRARRSLAGATRAERALVQAGSARFAANPSAVRKPLDLAYQRAMKSAWRAHPEDGDIGALYAESIMNLRPWDLWSANGKPNPGTMEAVRVLEHVLRRHPKHPLALHLYIHAIEASPNPEKAVPAADRLRHLQPALGHMVHMPSHIDVRVGRWKEAVAANARAMRADRAYRESSPNQGFYTIYMAHNKHMLAFAAMMRGQRDEAVRAMDDIEKTFPAEFLQAAAPVADGFMASPFEVRIRFGMWREILDLPDLPEYFPLARTLRRQARSVAYAALGELESARSEQAAFYALRTKVPADAVFGNNRAYDILRVALHHMNGEILLAEKKYDASISHLKEAVKYEDQLRYDEPPDWILPTRHTLGAVLLAAGRPGGAEAVYREDLRRLPNNGWSLYGLAASLEEQNRRADAARFKNRFAAVWADADIEIASSCFCVKGR